MFVCRYTILHPELFQAPYVYLFIKAISNVAYNSAAVKRLTAFTVIINEKHNKGVILSTI